MEVSSALCFAWAGYLVHRDTLPPVHNIVARNEHRVQRTLPVRTVFFVYIIICWTRGGGGSESQVVVAEQRKAEWGGRVIEGTGGTVPDATGAGTTPTGGKGPQQRNRRSGIGAVSDRALGSGPQTLGACLAGLLPPSPP